MSIEYLLLRISPLPQTLNHFYNKYRICNVTANDRATYSLVALHLLLLAHIFLTTNYSLFGLPMFRYLYRTLFINCVHCVLVLIASNLYLNLSKYAEAVRCCLHTDQIYTICNINQRTLKKKKKKKTKRV